MAGARPPRLADGLDRPAAARWDGDSEKTKTKMEPLGFQD